MPTRADGGAHDDAGADDADDGDGPGGEDATAAEEDATAAEEDPDIDPEAVGRPDFSGETVERDYGDPAPLVDGEYAVDRHPSDHATPADADCESADASVADDDHATREGPVDRPEPGDHGADDEGHHGGPPPGGWDRRGWLGGESTWFMLGPVLAAATGSVVLGLVPYAAVFLRLVDIVVSAATTVGVVG